MGRLSAWFGGLRTGMRGLVVVASLALLTVLSPLVVLVATLVFVVCVPVVACVKFGGRRCRRPGALLVYALGAALLVSVASNGLSCAPEEQTSSPSSSRNESKEEKAKQTSQDEAPGTPPKAEAARDKAKEKAEQPAAKPEPKPKPKPKPNPEPKPVKKPKSKRGTSGAQSPYDATVTVVRVTDGDTIEISPAIDGVEEVRLIGVDTPETVDPGEEVEPYGPQASEFATRELFGERVGIEFDVEKVDQYDRLLAYVYADGSMFNEELVQKGYAQAYPYPPNTSYSARFAAAQARARASGIGIWRLTTAQQCKLADRGNGIGEGTPGCTSTASATPSAAPQASPGPPVSAAGKPSAGGAVAPISEDDCPPNAPIKGNQSGLYHVPGGAYYDVTDPEQCFATPGAAEVAGYEASSR